MEQIQKLWTGILDTLSKLVIPDWGALIALLPLFVLVAIAPVDRDDVPGLRGPRARGSAAASSSRCRRPASTRRARRSRRSSGPSARRCSSSGSSSAAARSCSPPGALILTLLYWLREFMHDYDHVAGATTLPVPVDHAGPPAGVHMPGPVVPAARLGRRDGAPVRRRRRRRLGPHRRPRLPRRRPARLAARGARRVAHTEEADRTGHLRNEPAPGFPMRMFVFFTIVMIAAFSIESGFLPPGRRDRRPGGAGREPRRVGRQPAGRPVRRAGRSARRPRRPAGRRRSRPPTSQFTTPDVTGPAGKAVHARLRQRGPGHARTTSTSRSRTGATRSRAISSPASRPRSTRCPPCRPARTRSCATSTRR